MKSTTREWLSKAEGDYDVVLLLRHSRKRSRDDTICFLCQQCAEKYLKARLIESAVAFPKTHDLVELLHLVQPIEPLWMAMRSQLDELSKYAVEVRYRGFTATAALARETFRTCQRVRELARASLGLRP
jgi:HEPN domain-containing protein